MQFFSRRGYPGEVAACFDLGSSAEDPEAADRKDGKDHAANLVNRTQSVDGHQCPGKRNEYHHQGSRRPDPLADEVHQSLGVVIDPVDQTQEKGRWSD